MLRADFPQTGTILETDIVDVERTISGMTRHLGAVSDVSEDVVFPDSKPIRY
ncbi:MAG TPA: hypothetical protein VF367_04060 [Candidatus Limnocylindria bacterium]